MGICMENVVERPPNPRARFADMAGYTTPHGIQVLRLRGVETHRGRNCTVWDCQCPACGREFPMRQHSIDLCKSCGCRHRAPYRSNEAKDLRIYHGQLKTNPSRLCDRWQDGDTFIADLEDAWVTGHILCRPDESRPFGPDNWGHCDPHGGNRKSKVYNINAGTSDPPEFWPSNRVVELLKISRTRMHAMTDLQVVNRIRSRLNLPQLDADPLHPHHRQTEPM